MDKRPSKWGLAFGLLLILLVVRALVAGDGYSEFPEGDAIDAPSQQALATAEQHAGKVLSAAGLDGAQQYSLVCYEAIQEAAQIQKLDRCYAFDRIVSATIEGSELIDPNAIWFGEDAANQRWQTALNRMGLSGGELDRRRLAIFATPFGSETMALEASADREREAPPTQREAQQSEARAAADQSEESTALADAATETSAEQLSESEAAPVERDLSRPARPSGQASWTRRVIENYPSRALRQEIEGTVGLSVTIDPAGRVSRCTVTSSSGSSILDNSACSDIQRYARFEPALDASGVPVAGSWSTSIVYRIN